MKIECSFSLCSAYAVIEAYNNIKFRILIFFKWFFLMVSVFLLITPIIAEAKQKEKYYQNIHCDSLKGQVEYKLEDKTRIDCLTDTKAIEYDFATKWAECVGQAIYYAQIMKRKPVCALIGTEKQFKRYIPRIETINKNLINKIEIIKINQ